MALAGWGRAGAFLGGFLGFLLLFALATWIAVGGGSGEGGDGRAEPRPDSAAIAPVGGSAADDEEESAPAVGRLMETVRERLAKHEAPAAPLRRPMRVVAGDIRWDDEAGRPFLRMETFRSLVEPLALAGGRIVLSGVVANRARVLVARAGAGPPDRWNYEELLARDDGSAGGKEPDEAERLLVRDGVVRDGFVEVRLPDGTWEFRELQARVSRLHMPGPPGASAALTLERVSTAVLRPDAQEPLDVFAEEAGVRVESGVFPFEAARVRIEGADATTVAGVWRPGGSGLGLDLSVGRGSIAFADLTPLVEGLPEQGSAAFSLELETLPDGRSRFALSRLDASTADSHVEGSVSGVFGEGGFEPERVDLRLDPLELADLRPFVDSLPFLGTLRGTVEGTAASLRYDVDARLSSGALETPVDARLAGTASLADGFGLRSLSAELEDVPLEALRAFAPGLPLRGRLSGRVELGGSPGEAPLTVDVRVDLAGGGATVEGTLDLTGTTPAYDLSGELTSVQLSEIIDAPLPPVRFTGAFSARGSGFDPAVADASLRVAGAWSGWVTQAGDTLVLIASARAGTLGLETLDLDAGPVRLSADGTWRLREPPEGGIRYALDVADLGPVAPYIPALGDSLAEGSVSSRGNVTGTLERPQLDGTLAFASAEVRGWRVGDFEAAYVLVPGTPVPRLVLDATLRNLRTPTGERFSEGTLAIDLDRPAFELAVEIDREDGGVFELESEGQLRPSDTEVVLRTLRADLRDQRWVLERPVRIQWGEAPGVRVDSLIVRQATGLGRVTASGEIVPEGAASLNLTITALPVGEVLRLIGVDTDLVGGLWTELALSGTAAAPQLEGSYRLLGGRFQGVPYERLAGEVRYLDRRLTIDGELSLIGEASGRAGFGVEVPLLLDLDGFRAELLRTEPLGGTLEFEALPLRLLQAASAQVRDARGRADGRITLGGTLDQPALEGRARVTEGEVTVPALERRFQEISADLVMEGRRLRVSSLQARSGGWLRGEGTIDLTEEDVSVELALDLDGFRPVQFEDQRAVAVSGALSLRGPLTGPTVSGELRVADGTIVLPETGTAQSFEEELLRVQEREPVEIRTLPGARPAEAMGGLTIQDVRVAVGDGVWFNAQEARARLSGDVTVSASGDAVRVQGTLRGDRGTFVLRAGPIIRRFDVVDASVRFRGLPEPNPALDITASRTTILPDGSRFEVLVRVGGTLDRPTLALGTAAGETLPESQLLSFLLVGQPGVSLGAGGLPGEDVLEGAFLGGLGDLASIELEQALVTEAGIPFDVFQIHFGGSGPLGFGGPTVVVGKELTTDVFLTVDAGVSSLFGSGGEVAGNLWAVTLEWRIDPEWAAELGLEPINRGRLLRRVGGPGSLLRPRQELFAEIRRRWTY